MTHLLFPGLLKIQLLLSNWMKCLELLWRSCEGREQKWNKGVRGLQPTRRFVPSNANLTTYGTEKICTLLEVLEVSVQMGCPWPTELGTWRNWGQITIASQSVKLPEAWRQEWTFAKVLFFYIFSFIFFAILTHSVTSQFPNFLQKHRSTVRLLGQNLWLCSCNCPTKSP